MITNTILDEVIKKKGGLFQLDGESSLHFASQLSILKRKFAHHVGYSETILYRDKPRRISWGILNNASMNAFAYASNQNDSVPFDFVGINLGSFFILNDLALRLMSHPQAFPHIGESGIEVRNHSLRLPYYATLQTGGMGNVQPKCEIRRVYAGLIASMAVDFLFFHEISHLRCGHLEYMNENVSAFTYLSEDDIPILHDDPLFNQALELDADSGGVAHCMSLANRVKLDFPEFRKVRSASEIKAIELAYSEPKDYTALLFTAIYLLFRVFQSAEWDLFKQIGPKNTHPFPNVRILYCAGILEAYLDKNSTLYGYDGTKFADDFQLLFVHLESLLPTVNKNNAAAGYASPIMLDPNYLKYIDLLSGAWRTMRPTLQRYKRGGNLAP